ncbi:MAG: sulfate permease [Candidatus Omnitrophica bacterium]|nr:sulfate permease [Candidatus Omnitrophota bacterium]
MFLPKLFTTLKNYSRKDFFSDLTAGVIVGVVALPLAIAFGIASGVSPEKGLVTAVVAGFLISALGGSRVQIGGPTGAFVVIVYGIVQKYGVDGLTIATLMAGVILILFGLAQFGQVIKFISRSVVVGFTSGIAVIIFSSQVKDFLGLQIEKVPSEFLLKWRVYFESIHTGNLYPLVTAAGTIAVIMLWPRLAGKVSTKIPGSLIAIVLFSAMPAFFHWPVETIGSRFGDLPHSLPIPKLPPFDLQVIQQMIKPAFTIALLGSIESLLSAVVADGMIGSKHRSNVELVGQGIANIASSLFGGIPATGAIARTATNIKNGGRTPVAGIIHSITLLLILFLFAPWAKLIPLACLAGILVVVAYHMSEWRSFAALLKGPRTDVIVLVSTFLLTVVIDLTVAIEVGIVLSAFLFMYRMSTATQVRSEDQNGQEDEILPKLPEGIQMYDVRGPLFFGVAQEFEETMRIIAKKPKVQILRLTHVPVVDATGLHVLKSLFEDCQKRNTRLILTGANRQLLEEFERSGLDRGIGKENITRNLHQAIERAKSLIVIPAENRG